MRICDDRYNRDRLRLDLALRLIGLEARTGTIRNWTGLTDDRIRKLYRSYVQANGAAAVPRHRGKSPRQASYFTRTPRMTEHASVLASLCSMSGALPAGTARDSARMLPSIRRGELLCEAFDSFRALVPDSDLNCENAAYLLTALAQGDELRLAHCSGCGGCVVTDRWSLQVPRCVPCGPEHGGDDAPRRRRITLPGGRPDARGGERASRG